MAFLTGEVTVLALLPGFEGVLHHVAGHAELRVVLGMPVVPEPDNAADHGYKEEQ